jgi:hypothetical protein
MVLIWHYYGAMSNGVIAAWAYRFAYDPTGQINRAGGPLILIEIARFGFKAELRDGHQAVYEIGQAEILHKRHFLESLNLETFAQPFCARLATGVRGGFPFIAPQSKRPL